MFKWFDGVGGLPLHEEASVYRRKQDRPVASVSFPGRVLGCFDKDLNVRHRLFEDAVMICDLQAPASLEVASDDEGVLRFGPATVEVSAVIAWLGSLFAAGGYTYYVHHHDNIVAEVALVCPYEQAAFIRCLRLFRTRPANEGGSNLLGVVDPGHRWVLVLDNDNQGGFRFEFCGPTDACSSLRSHLRCHAVLRYPDR
jgi:hypothetical protein